MGTAYLLLFVAFVTGCDDAPQEPAPTSTSTPLPTLALKTIEPNPTPTLSNEAPARALPTPLITRTGTEEQALNSPVPPTPDPSEPTPVPSATPDVQERLTVGDRAFEIGDFGTAADQFSNALRQEPALDADEQAATLLKLGRAYLADARLVDAATIFNQLLVLEVEDIPAETHFWLGQAYLGQGEYEAAVRSYTTFLAAEPQMGAYVYPLIASAHRALDDEEAAIQAYESAVEAPSYHLKEVENRLALADAYLAAGDPDSAVAQYDAVHDMAKTEATRGQMTYLAGAAELSTGDIEAAHERFLIGVDQYPEVYESYLGLVELVKAEAPVDDYQRGLVDFHAAAYSPGIEALQAYIDANPGDYNADAHLFLAWSHEALGDSDAAFAELDSYAELEPQDGLLEQAKMRARAADGETAVTLYQQYLDTYPESEEAPFAAWWLAAHTLELGEVEAAIEHFVNLANNYPDHEDAPEALHIAGELAAAEEDVEQALELWTESAVSYPSSLYGSASLLALLKAEPDLQGDLESLEALLADSHANTTYQELRARDIAAANVPFEAPSEFAVPDDQTSDRQEAETWLSETFDLDVSTVSGELSPELRQDERLTVGQRLWQLDMYEEARRELDALRQEYAEDPLGTYQLALFLRDLGLYRSSIVAGATLLQLAGTHELEAPRFIGRLVYPAYYADQILPLAEQYGYDPRLQFSLVRQESLFESWARSGAAAQGLSQVIPDTGAWIAEKLQWPDYDNEDLYKPYVGLAFGAYYLALQLDYFDGDVHAALAAYNAGPGNAARWYETAGSDLDLFVDTIDFNETKTYVERIYTGYDIYSHLYSSD